MLTSASASSAIFQRKASFSRYSRGFTVNSQSPVAIASATPMAALRDRNGPITASGTPRSNPARRRSSGRMPPISKPMLAICAALTNR